MKQFLQFAGRSRGYLARVYNTVHDHYLLFCAEILNTGVQFNEWNKRSQYVSGQHRERP